MLIQEEAPRPAHPLATLDEDYERAVLHLVWDRRVSTKELTLLFAMVELLPVEVPPPLDDGEQQRQLDAQGDRWLHLRRFVLPARRALDWHLDCRRGIALFPDESGQLPDASHEASTRLILTDLGEEPPWPTLVSVSGESNTIPFCPSWHDRPRVHHLVPLSALSLNKLWPDEAEREEASRWVSDRLHFSLDEYPEYWGSIHLVAPNPVYRAMETRLYPRTPPRESVLVRFHPRAGKSVDGLTLTYTDKEEWGPLDVRHVIVKSPLIRLDFEREVQATKQDIFDPRRGILETAHEASYFLKSIHISFEAIGERVRVHGGTAESTYAVNRISAPDDTRKTGELSRAPSARIRMGDAHFARKRRGRAEELDQLWFSGQREEAANAVRSRIVDATRDVLIVDPDFGPDEFFTFAFAVSRRRVSVQILTSAQIFGSSSRDIHANATRGDRLGAELDRIAANKRVNPFEIRVMNSEPSSLDERFLVVDDRVWLLGSSLHTFGDRPTLMIALPNPEPIKSHLLNLWNRAPELKIWLRDRRSNQQASPLEGS